MLLFSYEGLAFKIKTISNRTNSAYVVTSLISQYTYIINPTKIRVVLRRIRCPSSTTITNTCVDSIWCRKSQINFD